MKTIVPYGKNHCCLCFLTVADFVNGHQIHHLGYIHEHCLDKWIRSPPQKQEDYEPNHPVMKNNA